MAETALHSRVAACQGKFERHPPCLFSEHGGLRVGIILNFKAATMVEGIRRVVL
jgi:hypothetical protein